jgi:hypothetical protein
MLESSKLLELLIIGGFVILAHIRVQYFLDFHQVAANIAIIE